MYPSEDTGVKVINIYSDAPPVHPSLLRELGAGLWTHTLSSKLNIEGVSHSIYSLLDTPYCIENIRNALASHGVLHDSENRAIKWSFQENIYLQRSKGLHLANKLNANHIYFENQSEICYPAILQ